MRGLLLGSVLLAAWAGAVFGGGGYDPASTPQMLDDRLPGMVHVAGRGVGWAVLMCLALPILALLDEGRIDRQQVRSARVAIAIYAILAVALMFTSVGAYRLAGDITGGWPRGFLHGAVGALIGAVGGIALGWPATVLAARLGVPHQAGPGDRTAEASAVPETRASGPACGAPRLLDDSGRPTVEGWGLILMLFGAITVVAAAKCLVFGPPPHSWLAYVIGPVLLVAGYRMNPRLIPFLRAGLFGPPGPPPAGAEPLGSGGAGGAEGA